MIEYAHRPDSGCGCTACTAHFASMRPVNGPRMNLARSRAENRPHLRDPAFLKFMGKVVGNTLKGNL